MFKVVILNLQCRKHILKGIKELAVDCLLQNVFY